jgi:hypothetical protein
VNLSCSTCGAPIGAYQWTPWNVSGSLSISYVCPRGHSGQFNHLHLAAEARKLPVEYPPFAPVDDPSAV